MSQWMQRVRKDEEGLTLIELIVVVAIIGVLAWLITPRVLNSLDTAKKNSAESTANEIAAAMERYAAEKNKYPSSATYTTLTLLGPEINIHAAQDTKYFDGATWTYKATDTTFCILTQATDNAGTSVAITHQGVMMGADSDDLPAICK